MKVEIPADEVVVAMLAKLGDRISARVLCEELVRVGHPRGDSQIAIQRAAERGKIVINQDDLSLSSVPNAQMAAA